MKASLLAKGWPEDVASVMCKENKESSLRQYQSTWTMFLRFLDKSKIPHASVSQQHIFSYLSDKLKTVSIELLLLIDAPLGAL